MSNALLVLASSAAANLGLEMPGDVTLRDWLKGGPFALALSSGFFGFFAHTGMLSVLEEEGLTPTALSGSSAGALVSGLWNAGLGAGDLARELERLRRDDFWDPRPGFGLLRGARFRQKLSNLVPNARIEGGRVPLSISVHDVVRRRTRVLTRGDLSRAIHASCAVPALFHPVWLSGLPHVDGGLSDRPGVVGLANEPRVLLHYLPSRTPLRRPGTLSRLVGLGVRIPNRDGLCTMRIEGLPRVGPFQLELGMEAYRVARARTRDALDRVMWANEVVV